MQRVSGKTESSGFLFLVEPGIIVNFDATNTPYVVFGIMLSFSPSLYYGEENRRDTTSSYWGNMSP